jgi:hypothetical protein
MAIDKFCFLTLNLFDYSMLMSSQSHAEESNNIRQKFPFEAEREEDGSLLIEKILGRRFVVILLCFFLRFYSKKKYTQLFV